MYLSLVQFICNIFANAFLRARNYTLRMIKATQHTQIRAEFKEELLVYFEADNKSRLLQ